MYKTSKTLSLILVLMFLFSMFTGTTFGHEGPVYDFDIVLTAEPESIIVTEVITFNIRVENTGNQDLNGIHVVSEGLGVNQIIESLPVGAVENILRVSIMDNPGYYTNTVTAAINMDEYSGEKTAQVTVTVEEPVYDFLIELTSDPRHLVQGEEATFNIRVQNTGNQTLNGILVVEEGLGIYQEITTLDPGREQNITKTKTMNELGQYEVLVMAVINMNEYQDEKTAQGSFAVEEPRYDLAVQMAANPETVKLGDEVTFSISIINIGNIDIQGITVDDSQTGFHETIPLLEVGREMNFSTSKFMREPGTYRNTVIVRFNAGEDSMVREAVAPVTVQEPEPIYDLEIEKTAMPETVELGKEVIYTIRVKNTGNKDLKVIEVEDPKLGISEKIKSLGAGEEKIFTSSAVMNELGTYTNTATASVNMPDVFSKTVRSEAVVTVKSEPTTDVYDFEIEKIATPETVYLGNAATFDITIKNTGNKDLFDIKIVDEMLDINREIALLPAGEEFHDSIDIVMNELGTFTNTVLASITMGEFSKTKTAQAAVMVIPAPEPIYGFELDFTATPDTVYIGEEVTYFARIANTGNRDLYNILIEFPSLGFEPDIIELLKAGEELKGAESFSKNNLGTFTESFIASVEMDEFTAAKSAEAMVTVLDPERDFTITKTVDDASVYIGDIANFEIVVENIGTKTMNGIVLKDEKIGLNTVIDTLEPGEENSYLTTTAVEMNEIGVYKNTATAVWEGISKSASAEVTVMDFEPVGDFIITKTVDDASVYKGETVNFEIVVENIGTKTMNNIVLKDEKIGLNTVIETLEPGEENSYRTTAAIKMDDLCLYKNTAEATWEGISKSASAEVKVSKKYDSDDDDDDDDDDPTPVPEDPDDGGEEPEPIPDPEDPPIDNETPIDDETSDDDIDLDEEIHYPEEELPDTGGIGLEIFYGISALSAGLGIVFKRKRN